VSWPALLDVIMLMRVAASGALRHVAHEVGVQPWERKRRFSWRPPGGGGIVLRQSLALPLLPPHRARCANNARAALVIAVFRSTVGCHLGGRGGNYNDRGDNGNGGGSSKGGCGNGGTAGGGDTGRLTNLMATDADKLGACNWLLFAFSQVRSEGTAGKRDCGAEMMSGGGGTPSLSANARPPAVLRPPPPVFFSLSPLTPLPPTCDLLPRVSFPPVLYYMHDIVGISLGWVSFFLPPHPQPISTTTPLPPTL
jgi:hypothetical protein